MLKTKRLIVAMAFAALALPAVAGSWPPITPRKSPASTAQARSLVAIPPQSVGGFVSEAREAGSSLEQYRYTWIENGAVTTYAPRNVTAPSSTGSASAATAAINGFEFVGGDAGWQLAPHSLVWSTGRFVHSDECDHVIRAAKAATPEELDSVRRLSPGA